jgi:hypothetical protein
VIYINNFKALESGLEFVLKSEYWDASTAEIEDFCNLWRKYLKDRGLKIEGFDPLRIEPQFPVALVVEPKKTTAHRPTKLSEEQVLYIKTHRELERGCFE